MARHQGPIASYCRCTSTIEPHREEEVKLSMSSSNTPINYRLFNSGHSIFFFPLYTYQSTANSPSFFNDLPSTKPTSITICTYLKQIRSSKCLPSRTKSRPRLSSCPDSSPSMTPLSRKGGPRNRKMAMPPVPTPPMRSLSAAPPSPPPTPLWPSSPLGHSQRRPRVQRSPPPQRLGQARDLSPYAEPPSQLTYHGQPIRPGKCSRVLRRADRPTQQDRRHDGPGGDRVRATDGQDEDVSAEVDQCSGRDRQHDERAHADCYGLGG
ncbi:hypothetical protein V8F06_012661 [Rhypophila decipiens]